MSLSSRYVGQGQRFGAKEAVAGIDLEIAVGSLAGLVGPNGAGKTTTLSMMTGLMRPDGGRILINELDVWPDPRAAKAIIGVVPDQARLFERLSGAGMLEYAGRLRGLPAGEARSRAEQLLDVLDLAADARRLVADFRLFRKFRCKFQPCWALFPHDRPHGMTGKFAFLVHCPRLSENV